MINQTIAHYKITSKLGQGGMGEVYRATDTKLDRDVAIKILPDAFTGDRDRIARFNREAKALAALNHPNIATIYGIEKSGDTHALVMELIEGETLGQRLKRDPMTVTEALECCKQIAEALEAAHEKGIIHRDLKPENVKITPDGQVKVLDFGIAKAIVENLSTDATTLTGNVTLPGTLLGTTPYMSPEQAKGNPVDKRSDIWSFGCVLYECLTGQNAFTGESTSEIIGAVMHAEPDWSLLPPNTPPLLSRVLRRCLVKDARNRLHDIADARLEIADTITHPKDSPFHGMGLESLQGPKGRRFQLVALGTTLVAVVFLVLWLSARSASSKAQEDLIVAQRQQAPLHFKERLPEDTSLLLARGGSLAWSPDGQQLVYAAVDPKGISRLYLVSFGEQNHETRTQVLRGTENASGPFFRPDGQWIGFFWTLRHADLKKVSVQGEEPQTLCQLPPSPCGGSWQPDGRIIYSPIHHSALEWTSATALDGQYHPLTTLNREQYEYGHLWPDALPGGGVLFTVVDEFNKTKTKVRWQEGDPPQDLILNSSQARYVSTGHLLFLRNDALWAVPFDLEEQSLAGEPRPVIHSLGRTEYFGAQFAVSANGRRLAFASGQTPLGIPKANLVWVDLTDKSSQKLELEEAFYSANSTPRLSRDEDQIAVRIADQREMQLANLRTGRFSPVPSRGYHLDPVWKKSADGNRLAYADLPAGESPYLVWQQQNSTQETLLKSVGEALLPGCFYQYQDKPGQVLAFSMIADDADTMDIGILDLETKLRTTLTDDLWDQWGPEFSHDGKWVAYSAIRNSRKEIWITPYPEGLGKLITDGAEPAWGPQSESGHYELYFRNGTYMMKVSLTGDSDLDFSAPEPVFPDNYVKAVYPRARNYDIAKDGRFLMVQEIDKQPPPVTGLNIVVNWHKVLEGLWP